MLNIIWLGSMILAVVCGAVNNRLDQVVASVADSAKLAVELSIGLVGIMIFWLGIMRIAQDSGLVQKLARLIRPLLVRLFPDVPADHPAMGSMVLNMAANMLGLDNAATPFGIRAMHDLEKLNKYPGIASNAMCTFLAINTSSVQLIPITSMAYLAAAGAANPGRIIGTTLVATVCSTCAAVIAVKLLEKLPRYRISNCEVAGDTITADAESNAELDINVANNYEGKVL